MPLEFPFRILTISIHYKAHLQTSTSIFHLEPTSRSSKVEPSDHRSSLSAELSLRSSSFCKLQYIMPRVPAQPPTQTKRRVKRHFATTILRMSFSSERLLRHPPTLYRHTFQDDDRQPLANNGPSVATITGNGTIPKPSGSASRLNRQGYNLEGFLCWGALYSKVQVCMFIFQSQSSLTIRAEICPIKR